MVTLLDIVLGNIVVVAALSAVVFAVSRIAPHPRLVHFLWLIVLVKLVTPPVWQFSLLNSSPIKRPAASVVASKAEPTAIDDQSELTESPPREVNVVPMPAVAPGDVQADSYGDRNGASNRAIATVREHASSLVLIWATGGIAMLMILLLRLVRFGRFLHKADIAPDFMQTDAHRLALRMRLRRTPLVKFTESPISPLLWAPGRSAVILLPRKLMQGLSRSEQRAILIHELAHLRRGDHLVRWFEVLVLAVHWFNPIAWLAIRELRAAEESCCDAWVVRLMPHKNGDYARALFSTAEFLSDARIPLPLPASGFLGTMSLKRRLNMILDGCCQHRMSTFHWLTTTLVLLLTPLSFGWLSGAHGDVLSILQQPTDWARLSPFTGVVLDGEKATVEYDGKMYELVSINDISTADLLRGAKDAYGSLAEKRFIEDVVEVIDHVGPRPGQFVKLVLRDPETGEVATIPSAEMTHEKRQQVYAKYYQNAQAPGNSIDRRASEQEVRDLIARFVAASLAEDNDAVAQCLMVREVTGAPPVALADRAANYARDTREAIQNKFNVGDLKSVQVADDRAIAISDFFTMKDRGNRCAVYNCVRTDDDWKIQDIDAEDVAGLTQEIGRFVEHAVVQRAQTSK